MKEYAARSRIYLAANPVCEVWLRENGWRKADPGWYERDAGTSEARVNADLLFNNFRAPRSTEVHHANKRRGKMLNDERYWFAVCRSNHERIESDKGWARREGFLLNF